MPSRCSVLIVDDTPIDRRLIEIILAKAGISFVSASSGAQALEQVQALNPLVILMDVSMPDMDGFEACQHLKAVESTSKIPVIFVTANAGRQSESQCFDAGGADFLTKPVVAATLLARIRTQIAVSSDRRRLEGMFRDVIEYAPVAILLADLTGQLVTVNASALACFGASRAELLHSSVSHWIPDIDRRMDVDAAAAHETPFEMACHRADASTFMADIIIGKVRSTKQALNLFIVRNIEERLRTFKELQDSRTRIRELGAQNELARENERKHIAREVHDELGQVMTALRMDLSMMEMRYSPQFPELIGRIATMKGLVDRAIAGVRQIAGNLRPPALDMGIVAALEWLAADFMQHNSARVELDFMGLDNEILGERAMTLYRIVQESLNNIAKYAQASRVRIVLRRTEALLELRVEDDGVGFAPSQVNNKPSFGLLGMRERALSIGADLTVTSQLGHGTQIHAQFPLSPTQRPSP